jgi:hypothetical protein
MASYNDINALYQKYLGRAASEDEANNWINGTYGATDLGGIESQIAGSGEAQAHKAQAPASGDWFSQNAPPASGSSLGGFTSPLGTVGEHPDELAFAQAHNQPSSGASGGDLKSRIAKALSDAGSTDDPNYWFQKISSDPNGAGSAWGYWVDRINRGDGALGVRNGTVQKFQDSGGGGGYGGGVNWSEAGASGGALPGSLQAYGVPTTPYQSKPWTGGDYKAPDLPENLKTPYTPATWQGGDFNAPAKDPALNTPYAVRQWTGGQFVPPALGDALRTGNTFDPATLPHFAGGVNDFSGGAAVVGEQGPEVVNLPPGSGVTPNPYTNYQQNQQSMAANYAALGGSPVDLSPAGAVARGTGQLYSNSPDQQYAQAAYTGPASAQGAPGSDPYAAYQQHQQDMASKYAAYQGAAGGVEPPRAGLSQQGVAGDPAQRAANTGQQTAPPAGGGAGSNAWSSYYQPNVPQNLQTPFTAPTQADLQNSPGFQSRLALDQQARERSAASRGSVLSGGTQLELGRAAQDYASNEYNNLFGQSLAGRGQNVNEYQNSVGNALGTRQQNVAEQGQQFNQGLATQGQNFGQYATQAGLDLGARQQNFNEGQGSFNNALAAYNTNYNVFQGGVNNALAGRQQNQNEYQANQLQPSQYGYNNQYNQYLQGNANNINDYLTNYGIGRTGVQDFFNQNNAVANRGLNAALGSRYTG